jgi:hypothetical protein
VWSIISADNKSCNDDSCLCRAAWQTGEERSRAYGPWVKMERLVLLILLLADLQIVYISSCDSYAEVRTPGYLCFFKDQNTALITSNSAAAAARSDAFFAPLDLRLVVNFTTPVKKGDSVQLDLELAEDTVKLKSVDLFS